MASTEAKCKKCGSALKYSRGRKDGYCWCDYKHVLKGLDRGTTELVVHTEYYNPFEKVGDDLEGEQRPTLTVDEAVNRMPPVPPRPRAPTRRDGGVETTQETQAYRLAVAGSDDGGKRDDDNAAESKREGDHDLESIDSLIEDNNIDIFEMTHMEVAQRKEGGAIPRLGEGHAHMPILTPGIMSKTTTNGKVDNKLLVHLVETQKVTWVEQRQWWTEQRQQWDT